MSEIISTNGIIPPGLRADLMRNSMENKNLLAHGGSLYMGTNQKTVIEVGDQGNITQYEIPVTTELMAGDAGCPLVSQGAGSSLIYRKLTSNGIELNNNNIHTIASNHLYYVIIDNNTISPVFYFNTGISGTIYAGEYQIILNGTTTITILDNQDQPVVNVVFYQVL